MNTFELIAAIMRREGWPKYTDHPADRGGPTKGGITLKAWQRRHPGATKADLQAITATQAHDFYWSEYVDGPGFDRIQNEPLRALMADTSVLHGPPQAILWLQLAAQVKADGQIGPISTAAINGAHPLALALMVLADRFRHYGRQVQQDPELERAREAGFNLQAEFAEGWINRAADFLDDAAREIPRPMVDDRRDWDEADRLEAVSREIEAGRVR